MLVPGGGPDRHASRIVYRVHLCYQASHFLEHATLNWEWPGDGRILEMTEADCPVTSRHWKPWLSYEFGRTRAASSCTLKVNFLPSERLSRNITSDEQYWTPGQEGAFTISRWVIHNHSGTKWLSRNYLWTAQLSCKGVSSVYVSTLTELIFHQVFLY